MKNNWYVFFYLNLLNKSHYIFLNNPVKMILNRFYNFKRNSNKMFSSEWCMAVVSPVYITDYSLYHSIIFS